MSNDKFVYGAVYLKGPDSIELGKGADSIELGKSAEKGAQLLWEAAVLFDAAPITGPLNLKLATCVSVIRKC